MLNPSQGGHSHKSSTKERRRYHCKKCAKSYSALPSLRYHQTHHPNCDVEPQKPDRKSDPACKDEVNPNSTPTYVIMEDGQSRSRYHCIKCGKSYSAIQGLNYHQTHHPNCGVEPQKPDRRSDPAGKHEVASNLTPIYVTMEDGQSAVLWR